MSDRLGGPDAVSPRSQDVLIESEALVDAWISAQRENYANSLIDLFSSVFVAPDVDVYYSNYRGSETIRRDPHPRPVVPPSPQPPEMPPVEIPPMPPPLKVPVPGSTLCLMVLFKQNGIAAFDMNDLGPGGAGSSLFVGTSPGSKWVSTAGQILKGSQYRFGGTGYILTQTDLSGSTKPATLYLSTTQLTDAIATFADIQAVPVMNSRGDDTVFTVGGAFQRVASTGALVATAGMAVDDGGRVSPYAIASDGTSYFFPTVQGTYITVGLDPKSRLAYRPSLAFQTALASIETSLYATLPNYAVATVTYEYETNEIDVPGNGTYHQTITSHNTIDVFALKNNVWPSYVDGVSYYGSASFGQAPVPQDVNVAQSPRTVEVFDPTLNHTVAAQTPANPYRGFGIPFYLPSYGGGSLDVHGFAIEASGSTTETGIGANTDKSLFRSLVFAPAYSEIQPTSLSDPSNPIGTVASAHVTRIADVTYPFHVGTLVVDLPTLQDFQTEAVSLDSRSPSLAAHHTFVATPQVYQQWGTIVTGGGSATSYSISGDYVSMDELPFPGQSYDQPGDPHFGPFNPTTPNMAVAPQTPYVDLHCPYSVGLTQGSFASGNEIVAFGQDLRYSAPGDPQPAPPWLTVHAHPPAWDKAPYFTLHTSESDAEGNRVDIHTVFTPYDTYPAKTATSFTPWLHVSNGSHAIQAYYVDGKPHAFVDGSTSDKLLGGIAAQCNCKTTEIVAMFMDIRLDTIQGVANVKPPDYSLSQSPPPGLP